MWRFLVRLRTHSIRKVGPSPAHLQRACCWHNGCADNHPLTHPLTHSLTHSPTHSPTHPLAPLCSQFKKAGYYRRMLEYKGASTTPFPQASQIEVDLLRTFPNNVNFQVRLCFPSCLFATLPSQPVHPHFGIDVQATVLTACGCVRAVQGAAAGAVARARAAGLWVAQPARRLLPGADTDASGRGGGVKEAGKGREGKKEAEGGDVQTVTCKLTHTHTITAGTWPADGVFVADS